MIGLFVYDKSKKSLVKNANLKNLNRYISKNGYVVWIDFQDPTEADYKILETIFGFHPLSIEDCKGFTPIPKIDEFDKYIFMIFHRVVYDKEKEDIAAKEMDFFLGKNYLVSLHEAESSSITKMKDKINSRPSFMGYGADIIMHGIIDLFTEKYIPIINYMTEEIERIEDRVIARRTAKIMQKIVKLKRNVSEFKRSILPQRDIIGRLAHRKFRFISEKAEMYYMDVLDNIVWVHANLESNREMLASIFDAYLSISSNNMNETSNRMNRIMQRLTIVATIFMPLTFITGVYGMNFRNMPELLWSWGYFGALGLMLLIGLGMVVYFRKKQLFQ
ncbi:MAG: magnesium/cobalt transporter CorA [Candidatus Omnitrophota bacterium]|nr:MAG: magnesium/cobalt transporter CorA [Candidatus Omnitrophota bacterium]